MTKIPSNLEAAAAYTSAGHSKVRPPASRVHAAGVTVLLVMLAAASLYYRSHGPSPVVVRIQRPFEEAQKPVFASKPGYSAVADPWQDITPSEKLVWHDCYGDRFQCARLTVPMDYSQPSHASSDAPKVHVGLVLYPAKAGSNATARAPMLVNPGGPGGSGTLLALALGDALQAIFGDDQPILGFDPRGIGFTVPRADCWATPPPCEGCGEDALAGFYHRLEWSVLNTAVGMANSSNVALKLLNAAERSVNDLCRQKDSQLGAESVLGHASTAHVARDMLSILDAWEEWQDSLAALRPEPDPRPIIESRPEQLSTKGKLVFWGFSYGTYLGATFASMFPDRVGRMLLDGVVDAENYVLPLWKESLHDTDLVLEQFFETCAKAGGDRCDLYRPGDSAASLRDRYHGILQRMESDPVTFLHPKTFTPVMVSPALLKLVTFSTLYSPIQLFPLLGTLLNYLYTDNPEIASLFALPKLSQLCLMPDIPASNLPNDAQRAIMCADKTNYVNMTVPEMQSEYNDLSKISEFADVWMQLLLVCNGWDINKEVDDSVPWHSGPFDMDHQIETAHPILFLSNTHDPVTPLVAGVKMARKFKDAGLIEQESSGHCTLSATSLCTAQAVVDYVKNGKLFPPPMVDGKGSLSGTWTKCQADQHPFQALESEPNRPVQMTEESARLMDAFSRVREFVDRAPRWQKMHTSYYRESSQRRAFILRS